MKEKLHALIPTDFSNESQHAINIAIGLSEKFDMQYSMVHVMPINSVSSIGADSIYTDTASLHSTLVLEMQDQARRQIKLQAERNNISLNNSMVLIGAVSSSIAEYAEEINADFIIMGTKKQKSIISWFGGSENQVVARLSVVPVLSISVMDEKLMPEEILYVHNLKKHPLIAPHRLIMAFKKAFKSRIHLLYINPQNKKMNDARSDLEDYLGQHQLEDFKTEIIQDNDVKDAIATYNMDKIDLICLGTHGRGAFSQLFQKSVAERLIKNADKPIFTFRIN